MTSEQRLEIKEQAVATTPIELPPVGQEVASNSNFAPSKPRATLAATQLPGNETAMLPPPPQQTSILDLPGGENELALPEDMPELGPISLVESSSSLPLRENVSSDNDVRERSIAPVRLTKLSGFRLSESVAIQCSHHIEYGKALARRGAAFTARQEFFAALRIVAQAADSQVGSVHHTRCLKEAIVAMREAEDFFISDTESQMIVNVRQILEDHTSPVIDPTAANNLTPIQALQQYYGFAQARIREACGTNVVSGEALYCLGKLHSLLAKHDPKQDPLNIAKAIVFHKVALDANPANYQSANELGVLLAKSGQMNEAVHLLRRSLKIRQTPQTWKNLADLHARQGQTTLAAKASDEYNFLVQSRSEHSLPHQIQWLTPSEFNQAGPIDVYERTASVPNATQSGMRSANESPAQVPFIERIKKFF